MIYGANDKCCGCTACQSVCGKKAITMLENKKGFLEPSVDISKCIHCGLCESVCPLGTNIVVVQQQEYYAAKRRDENKRSKSQSGGAFAALAEKILTQKGVVYGVALDASLEAKYTRIDNRRDLNRLTGSKYIQARVEDCYRQVYSDLKRDLQVLFSGTPCHVHGLKTFLAAKKADTRKLLTVDLICHGTPSPLIYREYLNLLSTRHKHKITGFDFRAKRFGWHGHVVVVVVGRRKYKNDDFVKCFYSHYTLRDSCYRCRYTSLDRVGDLTIGDCWGIERTYPEFDDNRGISLIITNSEKGRGAWNSVSNEFEYLSMKKETILQPNLQHPTHSPENILQFWHDYEQYGCEYVLRRYCGCDPHDETEMIDRNEYGKRAIRKLSNIYHRLFPQ